MSQPYFSWQEPPYLPEDDMGQWQAQSGDAEELWGEYCQTKLDISFEEFCETREKR